MKRIYCGYEQHVIVEENGKFGIEDKRGHLLLPPDYDRILASGGTKDGMGFILIKNGKFGYIEFPMTERMNDYECGSDVEDPNGCASAFLPCIYDRMEATRNGLAIYAEQEEGVKDLWYDFKSRILYRQVRYDNTLGDFDLLIDFSHGPCRPEIKKAGADEWVRLPQDCSVDILEAIATDLYGVTFVLCAEEITESDPGMEAGEYDALANGVVEYSFLLLYENGWIATPAKGSLAALYAEVAEITNGHIQKQRDEATDGKQRYLIRCKYKKRNETWR